MNEKQNHIGEIHGIYKIIEKLSEKDKDGHILYKGKCVICGYETIKGYSQFSAPSAIVKNCRHLNQNGEYKQFYNYKWANKRIGHIFNEIKDRCYNIKCKDYRWYGEKGIKVFNEWLNNPRLFEEWAINNGYSDNLTIDRIDENKDYCPENCRWITLENNSKYKSTTSLIEVNGVIHSGKDWAKLLGFGVNLINNYVRKYGLENTIEFIKRFQANPNLKTKGNQSYYDLYMD